jgi:hypothetical protein
LTVIYRQLNVQALTESSLKQSRPASDVHSMNWRRTELLIVASLLVALPACDGAQQAVSERPDRPGLPIKSGNNNHQSSGTEPAGNDSGPAQEESTKGDLKTFAYASTDAAALAVEVTALAAPGGASSTHYEAYELVDDAQRLEKLSSAATQRLKGTNPSHKVLVNARKDGIAAFSLTAEYSQLLLDLAIADQNDDLALLNSVANEALALEGTADQLADDYSALIVELEGWARTHPQSAAEALAKFGK